MYELKSNFAQAYGLTANLSELPNGFRYVKHDDTTKDLKSFASEMDKYTLKIITNGALGTTLL